VPCANTGKLITDIYEEKKSLFIVFEGEKPFRIDHDIISEFYLYKGKVVEEVTFKLIEKKSHIRPIDLYLQGLIARGHYSEFQLKEKLRKKQASESVIYDLIVRYRQLKLIDDDQLMQEWCAHYLAKGMGIHYIQQHLIEKGFLIAKVKNLSFSDKDQLDFAKKHVLNYQNKLKNKPLQARRALIYHGLIAKGFEKNIIESALHYLSDDDEESVRIQLQKDYDKYLKKFTLKYQGFNLNTRIYQSLRAKGYNNKDIKKVMEGQIDDLD
jgi:SOS response regulatory protein OraA/RecX